MALLLARRLPGNDAREHAVLRRPDDLAVKLAVVLGHALVGGDVGALFGKDVAQHIAAFSPSYLHRDQVPADVVENERRIAEATAREEGKPEAALPKIVEGRVSGFYKDAVLVEQAFAKDNKKSVQQVLDEAGVKAVRFARFRVGQS